MKPTSDSAKPVALVTGGTRGIGLGIAQQLATSGFDLAVNGRREESSVTDVIDGLRAGGADAAYFQADISSSSDRERMISAIKERFGRLDVLVNNAGVAPAQREDLLNASEESFDRLIDINLKGPCFLTQLAARWMVD